MCFSKPVFNYLKRLLALAIVLLSGTWVRAQVSPSSFKLFFEKVYLHTDRELYTAGEDIWFKAYLLDGQTNIPALTSNNLYAELIDPAGKIVQRRLIRLDKGSGNGDFKLGDSIDAGTYRLRAYTSWMRNFGDRFLFEKKLTVFATSKGTGDDGNDQGKKPGEKSAAAALVKETPPQNGSPIDLQFFPEGGSLVDGVPGLVAFKATGVTGKGLALKGIIRSSQGELLSDFSCDSTGMGSVFLDVQPGKNYQATGTTGDGRPFSVALPAAVPQGFSMLVRSTDSLLKITVSCNELTLAAQKGKPLALIGRSKGKAVYAAQPVLNESAFIIPIAKAALPGGLTTFTLYDTGGKAQGERLIYIERGTQAKLTVATDQASYPSKGKTTLKLKASDEQGQPVTADLSVAVVDAGLIPVNDEDIVSYLELSSEIKGEIEHPTRYFDKSNPDRLKQLDFLLLTQGWRNFIWKQLADAPPAITFPVEQGITISGKVTEPGKSKPIAGENITLFTPEAKGPRLFNTKTDTAGRYFIDQVGLYGKQGIWVTSTDAKGKKDGAVQLDSVLADPPLIAKLAIPESDEADIIQPAEIALATRQEQAHKVNLSDTIGLKEVKISTSKMIQLMDGPVRPWGKDEVFNIDPKDYDHENLFHYLAHYSRGEVGEVGIKLGEGMMTYYSLLYFHGAGGTKVFPRIFVNNKELPFTDEDRDMDRMANFQNIYFSLPLDKVIKVIVKHMLGDPVLLGGTGQGSSMSQFRDIAIVYLTLKEDALQPAPTDFLKRTVEGYYNARTFYAPKYTAPSAKTDLRTTLHWEPAVKLDEKGEASLNWYNGDATGKMRVITEGITDKGVPLSSIINYTVR